MGYVYSRFIFDFLCRVSITHWAGLIGLLGCLNCCVFLFGHTVTEAVVGREAEQDSAAAEELLGSPVQWLFVSFPRKAIPAVLAIAGCGVNGCFHCDGEE